MEDNLELSKEELEQLEGYKRISETRRPERVKQTVSLRITPKTLAKAKAFGKGYTSILSRLLDLAINDDEMLKKCL